MAKSEKQKLKLLYIIQCLMEKTDEEHAVTTQEIIDYLALQGITAERKSIYTDIDLLTDFGTGSISRATATAPCGTAKPAGTAAVPTLKRTERRDLL